MAPRPDISPEMTRILATLDEMAVLFLRLDQDIRAFAAAQAAPRSTSRTEEDTHVQS
ncbi:MAG: hypothetical protein Q4G49_03250 [Paracoccus sp. (in: a-proteobacteria)]|nr:hypothetical protein [Paracoccus sp. (in: a-proteobacteria)]